ncbi:hypothetical protein VNO80_22885 [Phaseolus coccineus]|uniref:Uncharacterized protein n=1 Tax=Phaseolus coccineus TaxID=3886 RepID=A0AAN9QUG5_PHACN
MSGGTCKDTHPGSYALQALIEELYARPYMDDKSGSRYPVEMALPCDLWRVIAHMSLKSSKEAHWCLRDTWM